MDVTLNAAVWLVAHNTYCGISLLGSVSTDEPASDPMTSSSASSSISSPFSSRGQPQQHASPDADSDQYYVFQVSLSLVN